MPNLPSLVKPIIERSITNIDIYGDSLTDVSGKNGEFYKFRKLPAWLTGILLGHSPWGLFSNGPATWADFVALEFEYQQKLQQNSPLLNSFEYASRDKLFSQRNNVQCWAQGGATAYNYNSWRSYFKFPKAFYARPFITHLGAETKKAYIYRSKRGNSFENSLALNLIGINDLLTIGYMDESGVTRAIQSIKEWMDFYVLNRGRDFYLANMPDITLTPRYKNKTDEEKKQAQTIVNSFNRQLKNLVESYRKYKDVNFEPYNADIVLQKDEVITLPKKRTFIVEEKGLERKVYFCQDQKYLENDNRHKLVADVKLSKKQWKLLDNCERSIEADNLRDYIKRLAISKAKLNCHVGLFDVHTVYQDIHDHPEKNGFTIGCALYTTSANKGAIDSILNDIASKSKNAVILQEITDDEASRDRKHHYQVHYIKEGQVIKADTEKELFLAENSDSYSAMQKIYQATPNSASLDAILIADGPKLRVPAIGEIISCALSDVKINGKSLHLADVSISLQEARKNSGLPKAKRGQPELGGGCLSWDYMHLTQEGQAEIAGPYIKSIKAKYHPKERKLFSDDMNSKLMPPKASLNPPRSQEAPDDITAWREPIIKSIITPYKAASKKEKKILSISSPDFKRQVEADIISLVNFHHKVEQQIRKLQGTPNNTQVTQKLGAFIELQEKLAMHGEKIQISETMPAFHQLITKWHDKHEKVLAQHRNPITRFFSKHIRSIETSSTTCVKVTLKKLSHGSA